MLRIYFNTREMEEYNENIKRDLRLIRQELEIQYSIERDLGILKQELEINKNILNKIIKLQDYNKLDNCNYRINFNKSSYI
jgi:hypothetical protein